MQFGVALSGGGGGGGGSPAFVAHCGKTAKAVTAKAVTAAFNHVSGNISKSKPQMMYVASQVTYNKLGHSGHFRPIFKSLRPN